MATSGVTGEIATLLRVSLSGMLEEERALLRKMLPDDVGAVIVGDRSYNVLMIDTRNPEAGPTLRGRVVGAVIVMACGPQERGWPGAVKLDRPLTSDGVGAAFRKVKAMVEHRTAVLGAPDPARGESNGGGKMATGSLRELAATYRFDLARRDSVSVAIEGRRFVLYPQRYLYKSKSSPSDLSRHREDLSLNVEVAAGENGDADFGGLSARRLDDFLWHLGCNAGGGKLLPWLDPRSAYQLTRWPPVVRRDNDSRQVKLGSLLARRTLRPSELCHATGTDIFAVSDFLNGCSLVGCLKEFKAAEEVPAAAPPRPKNTGLAMLLGRIRMKLGLT